MHDAQSLRRSRSRASTFSTPGEKPRRHGAMLARLDVRRIADSLSCAAHRLPHIIVRLQIINLHSMLIVEVAT
ncbi:MAG: hypothetical protein H7138_16225 [Myxococcales bacterium]|nr:hypothetical protein [Myxococcales bacterium]